MKPKMTKERCIATLERELKMDKDIMEDNPDLKDSCEEAIEALTYAIKILKNVKVI